MMGTMEVKHLDAVPVWAETFLDVDPQHGARHLDADPYIEDRHLTDTWSTTVMLLSGDIWVTDDGTDVMAYQ